jgi:Putative prokaryotic signal transducing protein
MDHSKLVLVQAFGSQGEADLAKSMLESAGIDALIQADTAGGMRPHIAWSGLGFRVLVREEDAAEARDVLKPPDQAPAGNLVAIQSFLTLDQAEIARDALESAGVAAEIQDLTWSGSTFRLRVREEDVATARQLLQPPRKAAP